MAAGDKKWDAAAERDLCVAIIMGNQEGRTNYNWPKVHAFLTKLGYKFTKDAIEIFRAAGVLVEVDGERTREAIAEDIRTSLDL